jgi:TolB-like protein
MGDGALVEFPSVVDAVKCAATIQRVMAEREAEVPQDRRILYRMGVNLGDIVIDGDDILGEGVNIAARLEGLAEPGGICIPRKVFEEVRNKLDVGYAFIGEQKVKNIEIPITVYRVLLEPDVAGQVIGEGRPSRPRWQLGAVAALVVAVLVAGGLASWQPWITKVEAADREKLAFPLPDKPSIAVLPFANLSGDAKQDYLGDGITENITTALSRVPDMFVIPRTSTRTYKGKAAKVNQVAEELGVRYVLEGSVQQSGDQVRVTAQLIDAFKGHYIWTESYDREVKDTFVLQDEITLNVLTELKVRLTGGALRGATKSLEAYQLFQRGLRIHLRLAKETHLEARRLMQEAIEVDPNFAFAWNLIGWSHQISANRGWSEDPDQDRARALELAHKALAIDPELAAPYGLLADISQIGGRYDEAIGYLEKGVALSPNNPILAVFLGRALILAGRPKEALTPIERGKRFSPIIPSILSRHEGYAYYSLGRYEEAIAAFERARERSPKNVAGVAFLAMTYADAGRMEEARAMAREVLELSPGFSAKGAVDQELPYKDRTKSERALATLRQLGLTENRSFKLRDKPSIAVLAFQNMSDDPSQEYFADAST